MFKKISNAIKLRFFNKNYEKLKNLYMKFNILEDNILNITNETTLEKTTISKDVINHLSNNINGLILLKEIKEKYEKINTLSNEILVLNNEIKIKLNDFNDKIYEEYKCFK